jgi:hypothetical protein
MPLTYLTVGNKYRVAPYSTIFPTTASIGTVSGTSVQITGITGPPNFTYSILRDGTTIATGQTGSTYTDSTVAGLTTYTYQIVPTNQYTTGFLKTIGTATTPVAIPVPDLLWYKCDNTTISGTTMINSATSGASYNGSIWTANGTVSYGTTKRTTSGVGSIQCVSSKNYFNITTPAILYPTNTSGNGYTVMLWIYLNGTGSNAYRILDWTNGGNTSTAMEQGPGIAIYNLITIQQGFTGGVAYADTSITYTTGVWYHVCYASRSNGGTGTNSATSTYYLNGLPVTGRTNYNDAFAPPSSNETMGFASKTLNIHYYDIRVYGTRLTDSTILAIYNGTK